MRAGARPRVQPGTFCSGPGQVSVSQDARAAEPHRRRLVKGKDLPAAKKAKLREKQLKAADPPPPPPSTPADATQATQIDDEHDHDDSAGSLQHADDPAPAQAPPARPPALRAYRPSFDNEPAFPEEMNTGCRQFVAWHTARRTSVPDTFTDEAQVIIMNTVPENSIDVLCTLTHVPRRKLLYMFLDELRNERGARKGEKPFSSTLKQSIVQIFSYLHAWQCDEDSRQLTYGDWDYRNAVFKPLHKLISERKKEEERPACGVDPRKNGPSELDDFPGAGRAHSDVAASAPQEVRRGRLREEFDCAPPWGDGHDWLLRLPLFLSAAACASYWCKRWSPNRRLREIGNGKLCCRRAGPVTALGWAMECGRLSKEE